MAASSKKITVLLVDDHAVVREGYRRLLEKRGNIVVVGEAENAARAHEAFLRLTPQITVMDIALPGVSGIEAMRRMLVRRPEASVLIFSMYEELIYADRALRAGACGYVTKASAPGVLVDAVHALAQGKKYLSADIAHEVAVRHEISGSETSQALSAREFEILRLLVHGLPVREIAANLGLNPKTVANHQSAIRQKLGADTSVQLARIGGTLLGDGRE